MKMRKFCLVICALFGLFHSGCSVRPESSVSSQEALYSNEKKISILERDFREKFEIELVDVEDVEFDDFDPKNLDAFIASCRAAMAKLDDKKYGIKIQFLASDVEDVESYESLEANIPDLDRVPVEVQTLSTAELVWSDKDGGPRQFVTETSELFKWPWFLRFDGTYYPLDKPDQHLEFHYIRSVPVEVMVKSINAAYDRAQYLNSLTAEMKAKLNYPFEDGGGADADRIHVVSVEEYSLNNGPVSIGKAERALGRIGSLLLDHDVVKIFNESKAFESLYFANDLKNTIPAVSIDEMDRLVLNLIADGDKIKTAIKTNLGR